MKLNIVDTTLRDGEQAPGINFSFKQKINLAKAMDKAGVNVIEAGIPAMGKEEIKVLQALNSLDLTSELMTWNRMRQEDVDKGIMTGIENLHISVPVSDIMIKSKMRADRNHILRETGRLIEYATKKGCKVSVGAEDASRSDKKFLQKFFKAAVESGAVRVRYADTVGRMNPHTVWEDISSLKMNLSVSIDFHGHNDFGMATANAFSAFKAGADHISCTINGIGERAGNTSFDEIVLSLIYMENIITTINVGEISKLSKLVEKYSKIKIHPAKPVVGKDVFTHESGIHVDGMMKNRENYQYLNPDIIGRKHKFVLGKHSGIKSVKYIYKSRGINLTDLQATKILNNLKKKTY